MNRGGLRASPFFGPEFLTFPTIILPKDTEMPRIVPTGHLFAIVIDDTVIEIELTHAQALLARNLYLGVIE